MLSLVNIKECKAMAWWFDVGKVLRGLGVFCHRRIKENKHILNKYYRSDRKLICQAVL